MEKRLLIAFVLSFIVLYGFRFMFTNPNASKTAEKAAAEKSVPSPATPPVAVQPGASVDVGETIQADAPKQVKIDTELFEARVSNVGGVLESFRLKKYPDTENKPTELIDQYAGKHVGFPLAIATSDPALDKVLAQAKFAVEDQPDKNKVVLEYQSAGVHAKKTIEFSPDKYSLKVSASLQRNGTALPHQLVWQGGFGDQSMPDAPDKDKVALQAKKAAVYFADGKFQRTSLAGIKDGPAAELTTSMIGVEDQYFAAVFMSEAPAPAKVNKSDYKFADKPDGTEGLAARSLFVSMPSTKPIQVYVGPKQEEPLGAVNANLRAVVNYGWFLFALIAKPLLVLLRWVQSFIGNWGWAIIVQTILINLVLFPLRIKQQVSMQKAQKLAPHMRTLQDKYKKLKQNDPKRAEIERELMEMNKQQMAGCLPMLLQMPLLIAFYNMMSAAIELRGAHWLGWIHDLSRPDPLYILPIMMGVSMFVSMKMAPASPDPAQARMMMITPVLMTLLFLWYGSPSGLTLYWLTGNVIGIAQQWIIRNYWSDDSGKPRQNRQPAPA